VAWLRNKPTNSETTRYKSLVSRRRSLVRQKRTLKNISSLEILYPIESPDVLLKRSISIVGRIAVHHVFAVSDDSQSFRSLTCVNYISSDGQRLSTHWRYVNYLTLDRCSIGVVVRKSLIVYLTAWRGDRLRDSKNVASWARRTGCNREEPATCRRCCT